MKQFIIFTEYVRNNNIVKERLKSILAHTISVSSTDKNGKATTKAQELSIDSYRHHDKYGGDNFDEMAYVALGDSAHPVYYRDKESDITTKVNFVVNEIEYDKKVFQPGSMTIKLSINPNTELKVPLTNRDCIKYVKEVFFNESKGKPTPAAISVVGVESHKVSVNDTESTIIDHMTNIAVRYLVFSFKISIVDSTRYVTLQCYSPDKLMELSKYSKVYSGQQFGEEIIKGEMALRFGFHESFVECAPERLRNLSMTDTEFGEKKRELVQPYLVQYNESFYDFIRRVAVRCGEFLCYRNGKFCLGLPEDLTASKLSGKYIFTYPDINIDSSISLNIDNFSSDYTYIYKETEEEKKKEEENEAKKRIEIKESNKDLSDDEIEKLLWRDHYYAEKEKEEEKEKDIFYAPNYVDDEQQHIVTKENDYIDSRSHWIEALAYDTMGTVLSKSKAASDIASGFAGAAVEVGKRLIMKTDSEKNFDKLVSVYPDDAGIHRTDWEYPKDADKMRQFVIKDSTRTKFLNNFYHKIEEGEKAAERGKVDINFSDHVPEFDLTDAIDLDDGVANYYIVSRMYGSFVKEKNSNVTVRKHSVEVIPTLNDKMQPCYTDSNNIVVLPPHCGIPHILKATAQEAVVMETKDPLQIGRVRVKYLWQGGNHALSPWIRVLVPFTGGGGGGVFMTPAIHDHVMINYTGGNIERPYVSGYLYTAERYPSKGATAADKRIDYKYTPRAITSQNGHSITFRDEEPASLLNALIPPLAAIWNMADYIKEGMNAKDIEELEKKVDEAQEAYHNSKDDPELKKQWEDAKLDLLMAKDNLDHVTTMEDITPKPLNGGMVFKDANGMYEVKLSATDRNISIKSPLGDINMNAFTGISISAPNGDVSISGKNVSIVAGNNLDIKSGVNIQDKIPYVWGIGVHTALGAAGQALNKGLQAGVGALSPTASKVIEELKNITDLSFIRNMWEVLMRPVEGTLNIKSKRNVLITAGLGKAWVPTSLLSKSGTALEGGGSWKTLGLSATFGEENNQDLDYLHNKGFVVLSLLRYTKQEVKNFYYNFSRQLYHINTLKKKAYENMPGHESIFYTDNFNSNIDVTKEDGMLKAAWDDYNIGGLKDMLAPDITDYWPRKNFYEKLANNYIDAYEKLRKAVKKFKEEYVDNEDTLYKSIERHWGGDAFEKKKYKGPESPIVSTSEALNIELNSSEDLAKLLKKPIAIPAGLTKMVMKKCIYDVLRGFDDSQLFSIDDEAPIGTAITDESDEKWQEFVDAIVPYKMSKEEKVKEKDKKIGQEIANTLFAPLLAEIGVERNITKNGQWWSVPGIYELVNWKGAAGPRAFCEYTGAGNILLSNNKGFTYKLDDDAAGFEAMRNPDLDAIKEYLRSLFKNTEPLVIT